MSIQQPTYRETETRNISYKEVKLPFEELKDDHIDGEELYQALNSGELNQKLPDYSITPDQTGSDYRVELFQDHASKNYIEAEIDPENEYSHLLVKIESYSPRGLESLEDDLDRMESGLESYFEKDFLTSSTTSRAYSYTD